MSGKGVKEVGERNGGKEVGGWRGRWAMNGREVRGMRGREERVRGRGVREVGEWKGGEGGG